MSRPIKQGIDYFPLDCQFDNETELLISEHGGISVAILITIWQLIYKNKGYYICDDEDLYLLIRRRLMIDVGVIKSVVTSAIKRGIFCTQKHKKYKILTSKGIQSRYIIASRLKKNIDIVENYLCVDISNVVNYTYIGIDLSGKPPKDSKGKKSKKKDSKPVKFTPPFLEDVIKYFSEKGYKKETAIKAFNFYDCNNWKDSNDKQIKNWKQKMIGVWFKDENKDTQQIKNLSDKDLFK